MPGWLFSQHLRYAPRAEAVGFNLVGRNVGNVLDSSSSGSQFVDDFGGGDVARSGVAVIVSVEWSLGRGSMVAKMENALLAGTDGAEDRVPG